jgi:hypothetical protein
MSQIQRTQLLPPTIGIEGEATKSWADKITTLLDNNFRKIAQIPFNLSESVSIADTGIADTEFSVTHHLGRVPSGFLITMSDKACSCYDSGTAWTSSAIYLKCNAASAAVKVLVF